MLSEQKRTSDTKDSQWPGKKAGNLKPGFPSDGSKDAEAQGAHHYCCPICLHSWYGAEHDDICPRPGCGAPGRRIW